MAIGAVAGAPEKDSLMTQLNNIRTNVTPHNAIMPLKIVLGAVGAVGVLALLCSTGNNINTQGMMDQNNINGTNSSANDVAIGSQPEQQCGSPSLPTVLGGGNNNNGLIGDGLHYDTAEGWKVRRANTLRQRQNQIHPTSPFVPGPWGGDRGVGRSYFQDNWEPTFACPYEMRLGHWGDGGKWICNPHMVPRPAVVYSLGSRNDFSFEESMNEYFNGEVDMHTFDFGVPVGTPNYTTYHQYFISDADYYDSVGNVTHRTLKTIMNELGHKHIDIFKIDIEGYEMDVLLPLLEKNDWPEIRQMQIELHLNPVQFRPTPEQMDRFFSLIAERTDLEIFHKEPNIKFGGGIAVEYGFVKVDWTKIMRQVDVAETA